MLLTSLIRQCHAVSWQDLRLQRRSGEALLALYLSNRGTGERRASHACGKPAPVEAYVAKSTEYLRLFAAVWMQARERACFAYA